MHFDKLSVLLLCLIAACVIGVIIIEMTEDETPTITDIGGGIVTVDTETDAGEVNIIAYSGNLRVGDRVMLNHMNDNPSGRDIWQILGVYQHDDDWDWAYWGQLSLLFLINFLAGALMYSVLFGDENKP